MPLSRIAIIGLGYVGLELSVSAVKAGHFVVGVDISEGKLKAISKSQSPVENVSDQELQEVINSNRFIFNSKMDEIEGSNCVIFCVPTSLSNNREPDLRDLEKVCKEVSPHLSSGMLIVNESTSFPGTLSNVIVPLIEKFRPDLRGKLFFGVAPERVNPGSESGLAEIPRIISGINETSKIKTYELYKSFCKTVLIVNSPEVAEAAKMLENSFRLVNISFINEINYLLRKLGIDTREVLEAASSKPYGFMPFSPGAGIGGHCIPVDPLYLQFILNKNGLKSEFVELASRINDGLAQRLIDRAFENLDTIPCRVLLMGVAYKEGLSDTRESPAENLAKELQSREIEYGWIDPLVAEWRGSLPSNLNEKWDLALVVTAQPGLPIESILVSGIEVMDLTGKYRFDSRVRQI